MIIPDPDPDPDPQPCKKALLFGAPDEDTSPYFVKRESSLNN